VLGAFVFVCFAVSAIGGAITATSVGTWYQGLAKPSYNPPDWVFSPVWTILYALMAFAAWRVWHAVGWSAAAGALVLFIVQLGLNLAWSALFFGHRAIGAALVEIVVLWIAIAATMVVFFRHDRIAGWMIVPYLLWVSFALLLNLAIWRLN